MTRYANLSTTVQLLNFSEYHEVLMQFEKAITRRAILRKAHQPWGELVKRRMIMLAPLRKEPPRKRDGGPTFVKPGRLKSSIKSRMSRYTGNKQYGFDFVWIVYPYMSRMQNKWTERNAWYRHFVEFGFVHTPHFIKGTKKYKPNKKNTITLKWVDARPFANRAFFDTIEFGVSLYKIKMAEAILFAAARLYKKNPRNKFFQAAILNR